MKPTIQQGAHPSIQAIYAQRMLIIQCASMLMAAVNVVAQETGVIMRCIKTLMKKNVESLTKKMVIKNLDPNQVPHKWLLELAS